MNDPQSNKDLLREVVELRKSLEKEEHRTSELLSACEKQAAEIAELTRKLRTYELSGKHPITKELLVRTEEFVDNKVYGSIRII